ASSADIVDPVSQSLVGQRPVLAVDLPGHGESDNTIGENDVTVARYRTVLGQALDSLGLEQVDFYGMWGGGLVGLDMAVAEPDRVRRLAMSNVLYHTDEERAELKANYTPLWEPDWYGGHLLMIWHMMRDQGLFWPWFKRGKAGIIWQEPYIDTEMVNRRVLEVFKAPVMWRLAYQSHFDYPTHEQLAQVKVPTLLCSPRWDPNYPHSKAAHVAMPHCEFMELEGGIEDWSTGFLKFLDN
ncbi:MAG: alpha/beta fold hydrolase, partial [Gammaproteobacteria bacterium]|nr:alpha/beta fold hydrolase [Gammaproteobacteria bacterium]